MCYDIWYPCAFGDNIPPAGIRAGWRAISWTVGGDIGECEPAVFYLILQIPRDLHPVGSQAQRVVEQAKTQ